MERPAPLKPIDQLKAEQLAACPNQGIVTDGLVIGEGLKGRCRSTYPRG